MIGCHDDGLGVETSGRKGGSGSILGDEGHHCFSEGEMKGRSCAKGPVIVRGIDQGQGRRGLKSIGGFRHALFQAIPRAGEGRREDARSHGCGGGSEDVQAARERWDE